MAAIAHYFDSRRLVHLLVGAAGFAALSWEILWQIKSALALGVSAWGTAITLAVTMGGMSVGAWLSGYFLRHQTLLRPVRIYGLMEAAVGLAGLWLLPGFQLVENIDTELYRVSPANAPMLHLLGIIAVLGVPTICMGATIPVFGLVARQFQTSIATLYGLNTLGAACGTLIAAFVLIPQFGVTYTAWIIAALDIAIGITTWLLAPGEPSALPAEASASRDITPLKFGSEHVLVLITGFATCALEVAWFRSLISAFQSTTSAFAIMLSALLIALGVAARLVPWFKHLQISLGMLSCWSGVLILALTPVIERFDLISHDRSSEQLIIDWFVLTLFVIGAPVLLLGVALPWVLDDQRSSRNWGKLYALNTLGAIAGSVCAAWLLLPAVGFARTAWLVGVMVAAVGIFIAPSQHRLKLCAYTVLGLLIAMTFESGAGRTRIQGWVRDGKEPSKILEFYEGPEATTSAIEYTNGTRALVINGFRAAAQTSLSHYMPWMGHLPMLLHPNPKNALVICFGTGQTANAVRQENPESLDIIDINPRVPMLAHNFNANEDVLHDPRVKVTIMDGRAYMRRTGKTYDVITLEPMPPTFAGVNALYSKEFYETAKRRLSAHGVMAQWLPFHLVSPYYMASIAKTFTAVFPNALLWIDPLSSTGIIVGTVQNDIPLTSIWPGFQRLGNERDLSEAATRGAVLLDAHGLERYGATGIIVSDDNQLLAYGKAVDSVYHNNANKGDNLKLLDQFKQ